MKNFFAKLKPDTGKRAVNFRLFFFLFVTFFCGIFLCRYYLSTNILALALTGSVFVILFAVCVLRKSLVKFLCLVLAFGFGLLAFYLSLTGFDGTKYEGYSVITGRATQTVSSEETASTILLDNVTLNGKKINTNLTLTVYGAGDPILQGDILLFEAQVTAAVLFQNGRFQSFAYRNNSSVNATLRRSSHFEVVGNHVTWTETLKNETLLKLRQTMTEENASIAYAILFGDRNTIESEIIADFRLSGLVHLLSISGLHVGLIAGAILFLLKKCRAGRKTRFVLLVIFLVFYAYLCGFAPSVTRAALMFSFYLLADLLGKRYDSLSSIGLAGLILLLVKPLYVFDLGFQLSFLCVIAIALFSKSLSKFFQKLKIPKIIAEPLAVSCSVAIGIFVVTMEFIGYQNMLTVFANLIAVPLFTVAFICVFFFTPFLLMSASAFGFLMWLPDFLLNIIRSVATGIASQSWAIISIPILSTLLGFIFYALCFAVSRFYLRKIKLKSLFALVLSLSFAFVLIFSQNGSVLQTDTFHHLPSASIITTQSNTRVLADFDSSAYNVSQLQRYLLYQKIFTLNTVVIVDVSVLSQPHVQSFLNEFSVKEIVYPSGAAMENTNIQQHVKADLLPLEPQENHALSGELSLCFFALGGNIIASHYNLSGKGILLGHRDNAAARSFCLVILKDTACRFR